MGVKSLKQLIKSKAPDQFKTVNLETFAGKVIAIDTSIFIYRFMYTRGDKFLDLFVKQVLRLYKNNILPIFVFDGKPPVEKNKIIKERKEEKLKMKERIDELVGLHKAGKIGIAELSELKKLERKLIYVTKESNDRCRTLLKLMGVPYIVANGEAEGLCVKLSREGYVEGCISEDTDVLANGGKIFMRDFSISKNTIVACYYKELLNKLELTEEQFQDVCILCGCDYTEKIAGIGHVNAYKIIKKYGNIETFIEECCEWVDDGDDGGDYDEDKVSVENESMESELDCGEEGEKGEKGGKGGVSCIDTSSGGGKGKKYKVGNFFKYKEARKLFSTCGMDEDCTEAAKKIVIRKPDIEGILTFLKSINSSLDMKTLNLIQNKLLLNYQNIMQVMYDGGRLGTIVMTDFNEYKETKSKGSGRGGGRGGGAISKKPNKSMRIKIKGKDGQTEVKELTDVSLEKFMS